MTEKRVISPRIAELTVATPDVLAVEPYVATITQEAPVSWISVATNQPSYFPASASQLDAVLAATKTIDAKLSTLDQSVRLLAPHHVPAVTTGLVVGFWLSTSIAAVLLTIGFFAPTIGGPPRAFWFSLAFPASGVMLAHFIRVCRNIAYDASA